MKKHTSEEAFKERLRNLAGVKDTSVNESKNRTLGTLIDFERAANGVAYGIVKEQHKYYIKKGGLNENLNVADFAYIGGLGNVTEFQYGKLAEAEKQRNMLLKTINEGITTKVNPNGSKTVSKKKMLTEDKAGKEIEMAASKVDDLDAATAAADVPAEPVPEIPADDGAAEMDAGLDAVDAPPADDAGAEMAAGDADLGSGMEDMAAGDAAAEDGVAPEGDDGDAAAEDGVAPEGDDEITGDEEEVAVEDPQSEATREIEKELGKLTNKLRKTELTEPQVKSYVNSFLSAFKDDFPEIDIEDRKAMAEKITKVVPDSDIEDLGQNVEDTDADTGISEPTEEPEIAEQQCDECGGFAQYAESRGYTAESIQECGEEEITNLVSGYANAHGEGQNDGDFKAVALFITPEIIEKLRGEYGHDEYADQVEPFSIEMNECGLEEKQAQINELFGNLGRMVGGAAKKVGGDIAGGVKKAGQAVGQKAQQVGQAVGDYATGVKQAAHAAVLPQEVKKLEKAAADLGAQIGSLNKRMEKAGGQPVNVGSILTTIKNQVAAGGAANLGKYSTVQEEEGIPVDSTEVQPMMEEEAIEEDVTVTVNDKKGKPLSSDNVPVKEMKEGEEIEGDDVDIDSLGVDDKENGEEEVLDLAKREEPEMKMGTGFENMGGAFVKPDGATTINVESENGTTVEVNLNEVLKKLRQVVAESKKPSAGLSKEKKSSVVKAAKKGKDIGKSGKNFDKVADKAAKEYGSKEAGEKVAAAAMWKNMSESEQKLRTYIRNRLQEHTGLKKPSLNESKKSEKLQKLDRIIDKQFNLYESEAKRKIDENINEVFGWSFKEKFAKLDPNNRQEVTKLFYQAFRDILNNPQMGAIYNAAKQTSTEERYNILQQYVEQGGGTLRIGSDGIVFAPSTVKNAATKSAFTQGGTQGKTRLGGV